MRGWLDTLGARLLQPQVRLGLLLGSISWIFSLVWQVLLGGRPLADPLPLGLGLLGLIRGLGQGLIYYDWLSPLRGLLFFGAIAVLAVALVRWGPLMPSSAANPDQVARNAVVFLTLLVAVGRVDAVMVAVHYVFSGFLAMTIASWISRRLAGWLRWVRSRDA